MRFSKPTIYLSTGLATLVLICGGVYWFYNQNYHDPRVLGVENMIKMNVPEWYLDPLVVSQGNNFLSITPLAGQKVKVENAGEKHIYRNAYSNTDVAHTEYSFKIKEEMFFKQPGHPIKFQYRVGNIDKYFIEKDKGNLIFYDKKLYSEPSGAKELSRIFTIPAPFVEDSQHYRRFDVVDMMIEEDLLVIAVTEDYFKDAKYPITLDPTVEINILNLYSHPQTGDDWEVEFTTQGQADLKIIPNDQATVEDDDFISLSCGTEKRQPQILAGDVIYYPNWQCDGTGKVVHHTLKADKHTLRFEFGDPAKPDELITAWAYNDPGDSWYDADWSYRKEHTINAATGAGTNYQVKITAHYSSGSDSGSDVYLDSHSRTDFADIRFTASNGTSLLDYWMESKTDSDNAVFWVEVAADLSSSNQDIYIYYGNAGQSSSASNGSNTFLFFDDFSGDLSKWTIDAQNTDKITIVGGALRHDPDSTQTKNSYFDTRCYVTTLSLTNFSLNYRTYLGGGTNRKIHQMGWRTDGLTFNSGYAWRNQNSASDGGFMRFASGAWSPVGTAYGPVAADTWYAMKVNAVGSSMETFIGGTSVRTLTDSTTASGSLTSHVHGVSLGASDYVLVDDVYVRKLVATEPAHSTWSSEEVPPAPDTSKSQIGAVGGGAKIIVNTQLTPSNLSSGLVGYWTFNGDDTTWTSATAGTTNDISGNSNTGTMTNMSRSTTPVGGKIGQAFKFDGVDDYVNTGKDIVDGFSEVTFCAWNKSSTGTVASYEWVVYENNSVRLYKQGSTFIFYVYTTGTSNGAYSDTSIADTNWHYVCGIYNGANVDIFVDGVDDNADNDVATGNITTASPDLAISGSSNTWDGSIDEVRIYNRALSVDEVGELYKLGSRKVEFQP